VNMTNTPEQERLLAVNQTEIQRLLEISPLLPNQSAVEGKSPSGQGQTRITSPIASSWVNLLISQQKM